MTYKPSVYGRHLRGLRLHHGREFVNGSEGPLIEFNWDGEQLVHNIALLQGPGDRWTAMGGLEGFVTNRTCKRQLHSRGRCLQLSRRLELAGGNAYEQARDPCLPF